MTKYVLSIDGGGVRGLASANFLSKLDKKIPKKLSESFDLLVGTSTGGIISLAISILDLEGEDLVKIYSKENLKKKSAEELSKVTGGINLPLDFKLPF